MQTRFSPVFAASKRFSDVPKWTKRLLRPCVCEPASKSQVSWGPHTQLRLSQRGEVVETWRHINESTSDA